MIIPTQTKVSRRYLLQETVLIILLSILILLNGTTPLLIEQNILILSTVLLTAAGGWLVWRGRGHLPAQGGWALFFAVFLLASLTSIDPRRSFSQLTLAAAGLLIYALCAALAARGWPVELFAKALLAAGTLETLLVWAGALAWYRQWLNAAPGQWLPLISYRPALANILAMSANLLLMLALSRLVYSRSRVSRMILLLLSANFAAVIFLTSSRGGWLGTAGGLAVLVLLLGFQRRADLVWLLESARRRPWLLTVVGVIAAVGLAAVGWLAVRQMAHPTHGPLLSSRSEYWPAAWKAFLASPLVGQGPFTYANFYLAENSVPPSYLFVHGHSAPLNLLAEMGLAGAAAAGLLVVQLVRGLRRRFQRAVGLDLAVLMGTAAGAAALAVQSLVDCFHTDPMAISILLVLLGAGLAGPLAGNARPRRPWWVIAVLALLWAELFTTAPLYQGVALSYSDWGTARPVLQQAAARDPGSVIANQQLALAGSMLADQGNPGALDEAVTAWEKTIQLDPSWAVNYANLGALYRQKGDLARARAAFQQAVDRAPRWSLAAINLGLAAEAQGDVAAAKQAYRAALAAGSEAGSFWHVSPLREQVLAGWLAENPPVSEDLPTAGPDEGVYPAVTRPYLQLAEAALAQEDAAKAERLLKLAGLTWVFDPDRPDLDWLWAETYAAQGNLARAGEAGAAVLQSYLTPGVFGPGTFGQLRYAPFMYRRPAAPVELVPQLAQAGLPDRWTVRARQSLAWLRAAGEQARANELEAWLLEHDSWLSMDQLQETGSN